MLILNFRVASKQAEIANTQAKVAQTRLVMETFSRAVEQLESDKLAIRLGAIYSLERIADSPSFYWMSINVLNAVVREKSPLVEFFESQFDIPGLSQEELIKRKDSTLSADHLYAKNQSIATDIAAILSFLGKPDVHKEAFLHELGYINLSKTELIGSQILSADFRRCYFQSTDFRCASIFETNFKSADLREADFRWAKVEFSDFTEAILIDAKFNQAELSWTKFNQAKLIGAVFTQANLKSSKFDQAKLI